MNQLIKMYRNGTWLISANCWVTIVQDDSSDFLARPVVPGKSYISTYRYHFQFGHHPIDTTFDINTDNLLVACPLIWTPSTSVGTFFDTETIIVLSARPLISISSTFCRYILDIDINTQLIRSLTSTPSICMQLVRLLTSTPSTCTQYIL